MGEGRGGGPSEEGKEGERGKRNSRERDQLLVPVPPPSRSPPKPAPARTLDQQVEALGAAEEGDRGHGRLTDVGARRVEGDGAQREGGAVPQGDEVLAGREGGGQVGVRAGSREGRGCGLKVPGLRAPFPLTLVQRRAGVGSPRTEQFTVVLLPKCKESSSPVLSSRGSRSGGGDRLSPSPAPHPCG